jgi:hypothetical protein
LLQDFQVTDGQDVRSMCDGAPFSSREAYRQLHAHLADDSAVPLWQSRLPHRIRVFGWLLSKDRLNTRALLARKTIIDDSSCPRCPTTSEDRQHLFITCPAATEVWGKIGIKGISFDQDDLWTRSHHTMLHLDIAPFAMTTIMWRIWDARNSLIFRQQNVTCNLIISRVIEDLALWSHRIRNGEHKAHLMLWRNHLSSCIM